MCVLCVHLCMCDKGCVYMYVWGHYIVCVLCIYIHIFGICVFV